MTNVNSPSVRALSGVTFSSARSRLLRSGGIPFASASLREKATALAAELDRIEQLRAIDDVSKNEARQMVANAIAGFRRAAQADAAEQRHQQQRVVAAGERLQATVEARLAKITPFELEQVKRRAAAIEAGQVVSAPAAAASRDVVGLLAVALTTPSVGYRGLAAVWANGEANELVRGAATIRAALAAEAADAAADELSQLPEAWSARNKATPQDMVSAGSVPPASQQAPTAWPGWVSSFLDLADPAPATDAPAAQQDGAKAAEGVA